MRFIKSFIFGLTGLFVFATLLSLLIPFHIKISRVVVINTTPDKVYPQVINLRKWKNWHPLFKMDSAVIVYSGSPGGADQDCTIQYNNRSTKLHIESVDSAGIKFLLQSDGENDIQNEISLHQVADQPGVEVEWKATVHLRWYPWEKVFGIFLDKIAGPGYEAALNGLKGYFEAGR